MIFIAFSACKGGESLDEKQISKSDNEIHDKITYRKNTELELKVDSIFQNALHGNEINGAAISIVKGNEIILLKPYGYKDASKKSKLTNNSVFRIGSVSKSITGVVAGVLYQKGLLNFDEKIITYDPDCELHNPLFTESLKLSHLLSHTSGLPYHSYTNLIEYGVPMNKIICKFHEILNLEPPGKVYSYQNAAFAESGEILAKKLNIPLVDIYNQYLFEPLGMETASTSYQAIKEAEDIAKPHKKNGNKWVPQKITKKYYNAIPAGGVNASIKDMSKILHLMLGNNPEILSSEAIDTITQGRINTKVKHRYYKKWAGFENSFYGFGWRVHTLMNSSTGNLDTILHHGGQVNNYRSEIAIDRNEKIGICVLFNSYTPLANTIIPELLNIVKNINTNSVLTEPETSTFFN